MKILQINSVYKFGSTGKIVKKLHDYLLSLGHESYVIYGRMGAIGEKREITQEKNVFYIHNDFEQNWEILSGTVFDTHGLHNRKNTEEIIRKIKEINPDVIHLHNIHNYYLNYEMLFEYLKTCHKRIIWTLHDCWSYTGYCGYYDYNECNGFLEGCKKCPYHNVYPYRIFSNSANNYERKMKSFLGLDNLTIVTPSVWLKEEVAKSFLKNYECVVVNNSFDKSKMRYNPDPELLKKYHIEDKRIALSVANPFTPKKGLDDLIKLSEILSDKWQLVLVGLDSKQVKKLPKNIIGIERTNNQEELVKWYSNAEVFLNFSLQDNYPTVNIESMSCGTPVIGYRTGGIPEQIKDTGYIIDRHDYKKAAELMENTVFKRINYEFTDNMSEKYLALYQRL